MVVAGPVRRGGQMIMNERNRQIDEELFLAERDDKYERKELLAAASCYLDAVLVGATSGMPMNWPFDSRWWKPKDDVTCLKKAGALIAAYIDVLLRAEDRKKAETSFAAPAAELAWHKANAARLQTEVISLQNEVNLLRYRVMNALGQPLSQEMLEQFKQGESKTPPPAKPKNPDEIPMSQRTVG